MDRTTQTRMLSVTIPLIRFLARLVDRLVGTEPEAGNSMFLGWKRARVCDKDRVLLSETHLWLRRIPASLLPKRLCRQHPHLANRFAERWGKRKQIEALVDDLLTDKRGSRRGFSPLVRLEIQQLEGFHARWLEDPQGVQSALVARSRRVRSDVSPS